VVFFKLIITGFVIACASSSFGGTALGPVAFAIPKTPSSSCVPSLIVEVKNEGSDDFIHWWILWFVRNKLGSGQNAEQQQTLKRNDICPLLKVDPQTHPQTNCAHHTA